MYGGCVKTMCAQLYFGKKHILFIITSVYLNKTTYLCHAMVRYYFEKKMIVTHKRFFRGTFFLLN